MTHTRPVGDIKYYKYSSILIITALAGAGAALLFLNSSPGRQAVFSYLGPEAAFGLQLFFWGALGAAIASSLFLARDKEENEVESMKEPPDFSVLRYPTDVDVYLYAHRMLTSACLAVIGGLLLYAGLGYFDVPANLPNPKQRAFFILFAFLIGLYEGNLLPEQALPEDAGEIGYGGRAGADGQDGEAVAPSKGELRSAAQHRRTVNSRGPAVHGQLIKVPRSRPCGFTATAILPGLGRGRRSNLRYLQSP